MTERWTDKKRGFLSEPGNLMPNVPGLSLNRFMRENLGGLDQTQVKRVTPEGNVTVKGFGMYEKIYSELKAEKEIKINREMCVMFEDYSGRQIIKLIEIKTDGYKVHTSLDVYSLLGGGSAISASWSYEKNKFIIFSYNYGIYQIYEITIKGVSTLVAQYELSDDLYATGHYSPELFHSYGSIGQGSKLWLGFDPYYYAYYYLLTLRGNYSFGNYTVVDPDIIMQISLSDLDSYHHPTWNVPTLSWVTHDDVRIIKPVTDADENWYGQANQRVCEVGNKVAVIYDEDIQSFKAPYAIHLCSEAYKDTLLVDENEYKYTPATYLGSFSVVKESEIFASGGNAFCDLSAVVLGVTYTNVSIVSIGDPIFNDHIGFPYYGVYWTHDGCIYFPPGHPVDFPDYFWAEESFEVQTYPTGLVLPTYILNPIGGITYVGIPSGWPPGDKCYSIICCWHTSASSWVNRENYYDMRYVNKHYIVVGEENTTWNYRVFIADNNGTEKYEISCDDPDNLYDVRLERVIIQ